MSEESKASAGSIGDDAEFMLLLSDFACYWESNSTEMAHQVRGEIIRHIDSRPRQGDQGAEAYAYARALDWRRKHADSGLMDALPAPSDTQGADVELPEERCLHWDGVNGYEADQMLEFGAQQREAALREAAEYVRIWGGDNHAEAILTMRSTAPNAALAQQAPGAVRDAGLVTTILTWWEEHQYDTSDRGHRNVFDSEPEFVTVAKKLAEAGKGE